MRIVVAPAGSRGDFQPLLALAVGLRAVGHDVLMVVSPNFVAEAETFGVPARAVGFDVLHYLREAGFESSPIKGAYTLFKIIRDTIATFIDEALPYAQGADLVVGAGAQFVARTVADSVNAPYAYVAYTPQALWSSHHAPALLALGSLPRILNRVSCRRH